MSPPPCSESEFTLWISRRKLCVYFSALLLSVSPTLSSRLLSILILLYKCCISRSYSLCYFLQTLLISSPCWIQIFPSVDSAPPPPHSSLYERSGFTTEQYTYFPYCGFLYEAVRASDTQIVRES